MIKKFFKAVYSLVSSKTGGLSIGRVAFWVTFGYLCYYWFHQYNVPPSMVDICQTTLGYELFKKARDVWDAKNTPTQVSVSNTMSGEKDPTNV